MLVFIDESGDPGFKLSRGSSPHFVLALVAFPHVEMSAQAEAAIDEAGRKLGIRGEFKFSKSRPEVRDGFFASVVPVKFCVRAIVVEKAKIYSPHLRTEKDAFYAFFVKSMLQFDGGLLKGAKVVIDGSGDRSFKKELGAYLKRHAGIEAIKAVAFSDSKNDRLVQLADMCAGAIARTCRADKEDARRWHDMLKPRIEDIWNFR